jgi:hypothetical protein
LGFGLLLMLIPLTEIAFILAPGRFDLGLSGDTFPLVVDGIRSFLAGGAYLMLIGAVFAGRKPRAPLPPDYFPPRE